MIDLQSQTEGGKVFQILGWTETWEAHEPKLRLRRGTDSKQVAKECIDLAGLCSFKNSL